MVFRAKREMDFTRTLSIRPLRQSERRRWKSGRFSAEVPEIPASAYRSTSSQCVVYWLSLAFKEGG